MLLVVLLLVSIFFTQIVTTNQVNNFVFHIRNQDSNVGLTLGNALSKHLTSNGVPVENIVQVAQQKQSIVLWWYFPMLEILRARMKTRNANWAVFLETGCEPNVDKLKEIVGNHDPNTNAYLGSRVLDKNPAIIHHYNMDKTMFYPDRHRGFLLSKTLIDSILARLSEVPEKWSFHIDAIFEFNKFIKEKLEISLTHVEMPTKLQVYHPELFQSSIPLTFEDIVIGIKTCEMFYGNRVPLTKRLWSDNMPHAYFFSEKEDKTIPTIPTGVPNAERGHCVKTRMIMDYLYKNFPHAKWYCIADDDTILNPERLRKRLEIYDHNDKLFMGERYGFMLNPQNLNYGYNYITGGPGMWMTRSALGAMVNCPNCRCANKEDPDDMRLGSWGKRLGLKVITDSTFHQASPEHYHPTRLSGEPKAVAFHKHSGRVKPDQVVKDYLTEKLESKDEL